jgi:hypothetical protein
MINDLLNLYKESDEDNKKYIMDQFIFKDI